MESRHVYINPVARIFNNTPNGFTFEGRFDVKFPAEWHELLNDLIKHDRITMKIKGSVSVLEVHHWNGCSKPVPYICDNIPFYDSYGTCIGVVLNAKPASTYNPTLNRLKKKRHKIPTHAGVTILDKEHEVIRLIIQGYTKTEISDRSSTSLSTVEFRLHSAFLKKSIFNTKKSRVLYINNPMDSHIPSSMLSDGLLFL